VAREGRCSHADSGAADERLRRAVGPDRAAGVSGLDAGAWPAPSAAAAVWSCPPRQPAATAPGLALAVPEGGAEVTEGGPWSGQVSRCARRPHPRVLRGRSMIRIFRVPQAMLSSVWS